MGSLPLIRYLSSELLTLVSGLRTDIAPFMNVPVLFHKYPHAYAGGISVTRRIQFLNFSVMVNLQSHLVWNRIGQLRL